MAGDALARVRRAYEVGRVRRAALGAAPLLVVLLPAALLVTRPTLACALGVAVLVFASAMLWRSRAAGQSVVPGVALGAVPLYLAMCARSCGHFCTGATCMSLCIPACAIGGFVAGGALSWMGRRAARPWLFLGVGSGLALLTGSLGCCCVGYGGVIGLAAGLLVGSASVLGLRPYRTQTA